MHRVYIGLGSNLGNRERQIADAIRLLGERVGKVLRQSSVLETEPWGFVSANSFLNAAVCCETELSPRQVLHATQAIERELGKRRRHASAHADVEAYHDRPIDIDILLYDDLTVCEPGLTIPHPRMSEREFVMKPLGEIMMDKSESND